MRVNIIGEISTILTSSPRAEKNEIFIRAIQSLTTNETTLFLYANDRKLYRKVQLKMESSPVTFLSDEIGKIELGYCDINSLDEQHFVITTEIFFKSIY